MKERAYYRSRGIDKMERYGVDIIKKYLESLVLKKEKIRILEIGFGEGKCLIDLRKLFPQKNIEFYGVNNIKKGNMKSKLDFFKNAKYFGVDISKTNLPQPYFYDVGDGLKFKDNYFDLIISQVAIQYVGNKAKLFEDIWRTLKVNGKAFLHIDGKLKDNHPDFVKHCKDTPMTVIYKNNKIISTKKYINDFKTKKGFNIRLYKHKNLYWLFTIEKNKKNKLNFNLNYDGNSTLYLTKLKESDPHKTDRGIWWGTRSVFQVK